MSMTLISTINLTGGEASVGWFNIPQDGTDLLVTISGRSQVSQTSPSLLSVFLNVSFTSMALRAANTTVAASTTLTQRAMAIPAANDTANNFGNAFFYLSDYASSDPKNFYSDSTAISTNTSNLRIGIDSMTTASNPINELLVGVQSGTWAANSTLSLYKITKGSGGAIAS